MYYLHKARILLLHAWVIPLFSCFPGPSLWSQTEDEIIIQQNFSGAEESLVTTYLNNKADVQKQIRELQSLARQDRDHGDVLKAIQKVQVALMLEKELKRPVKESFDLNFFAGQLMAPNDLHYAGEFFKKACAMVPSLEQPVMADIFDLYTNRAGIHSRLGEPDTALFYFHKAIQAAKAADQIAYTSSLNNIGVFFLKSERFDSAKFYLELAQDQLGDRNNSIPMYCAIRDNLAALSIHNRDYTSALLTYAYNDSVYITRELSTKYMANKIRMMKAMQELRLPGIEAMIENLEAYRRLHSRNIQNETTLHFFRFADQYYYTKANFANSKKFQQRYISWADSLDQLTSDRMHSMAKSLMTVQRVSFENEMKANELIAAHTRMQLKSTRRLLITSVIAAISILAALIFYYRKRRQELHAQRLIAEAHSREKEMEARLVAQELDLKKKDLTNLVLHNTQVYDANQKMIERLQRLSGSNGDTEVQIHSLLSELQSQNQVSERSQLLMANIEIVNAEFFEKLKIKYPDLTKAEVELCGYIRINLSSKDIAILKNVEAASVKMSKNRLRKKLEVSPEEDIYALIQKV